MAKPTGSDTGPATESRAAVFMRSALAILGETGRTDFTVLEVVERSKTSARAFYQHFATKDELLLALIETIIAESCARWREETAALSGARALQRVLERISDPAQSSTQDSINRGLTFYNDHLVQSRPREFARVLRPLHALLADIIRRGIVAGDFRDDVNADTAATIVMETAMGALRMRALGSELSGAPIDSAALYQFCARALSG